MQATTSTYRQILASDHDIRYRVLIYKSNASYDTYNMHDIVSIKTTSTIFGDNNPSAGDAISGQIDLHLTGFISEPPKAAKLIVQSQIFNSNRSSEWITSGTYFIDTRKVDATTGEVTITGMDALTKSDRDIYKDGTYTETWPKTDIETVEFIASNYLKCNVDSRTFDLLTRGYMIPFPGYGDNALTARDLLKTIAAMNGGNFIISPIGELRFVQLNHIPSESVMSEVKLSDEEASLIVFGDFAIDVREV